MPPPIWVRLVACWLLAFGPIAGWAQPPAPDSLVVFSGVLLDEATREPMPGATIFFDSLRTGATTNLDGVFQIRLPNQVVQYRIAELGYEVVRDSVDLTAGAAVSRTIVLPNRVAEIEAVTIHYYNPAIRIMREAIRRKRENQNADLEKWQRRTYNKLTVCLNDITPRQVEHALWLRPARDFLRQHLHDSAIVDSNQLLRVTVFISESITDQFYQRPNQTREVVLAARTSGLQTDEANILGGTFTNVDLYENTVTILGKQFVSPMASGGFLSYLYVLMDQEIIDEDTVFTIECRPLNRFDPSFAGRIYIHSRNFALQKADLKLSGAPVVNFVEDVRIRQEFQLVEGNWMLKLRDTEVDFANREGRSGLLGRSVSHFATYDLRPDLPRNFFGQEVLTVDPASGRRDSSFWDTSRTVPLERSDVLGFQLTDALQSQPIWKWIRATSQLLSFGGLRVDNFVLGPYSRTISYNPVEGLRTQLGFLTAPEFNSRWFFSGWAAYGMRDERFKYGLEGRVKINLKPRVELVLRRTDNTEQLGMSNYGMATSSLLVTALMRVPLRNLNYSQENYAHVEMDIMRGLAGRVSVLTKHFEPAFAFAYRYPENQPGSFSRAYDVTDVGLWLRVSFREDYFLKRHEKIYLDTEIPQFYLEFGAGLPGVLHSDFAYYRTKITAQDRLKLGRFGWMTYTLSAGKIFGSLPYPSLYIFRGSQSYAMTTIGFAAGAFQSFAGGFNRTAMYDEVGFNLMHFYEFIADEFLVGGIDYHMGGWFLRKLPLVRRLRLKELFTLRMGWGRLSPANHRMNTHSAAEMGFTQTVQAPYTEPYTEVGIGLENIFKILRIDYVWRLTYRDPDVPAPLRGFNYNSGLRFQVSIGF